MLPRKNRLNAKQFKHIYDRGVKFRGEYGMLIVLNEGQEDSKIGFVVSKKIGNAVQRHRMTRLLREIAKRNLESVSGRNMIYVAYKYYNEYEKLQKDFDKQFKDSTSNT